MALRNDSGVSSFNPRSSARGAKMLSEAPTGVPPYCALIWARRSLYRLRPLARGCGGGCGGYSCRGGVPPAALWGEAAPEALGRHHRDLGRCRIRRPRRPGPTDDTQEQPESRPPLTCPHPPHLVLHRKCDATLRVILISSLTGRTWLQMPRRPAGLSLLAGVCTKGGLTGRRRTPCR